MKAAGIGVAFVGYTLVWWGWYRLGGPVNLLDLIVPGRPAPVRASGGSGGYSIQDPTPPPNASSSTGLGGGFANTPAGGGGGGGTGGGW